MRLDHRLRQVEQVRHAGVGGREQVIPQAHAAQFGMVVRAEALGGQGLHVTAVAVRLRLGRIVEARHPVA